MAQKKATKPCFFLKILGLENHTENHTFIKSKISIKFTDRMENKIHQNTLKVILFYFRKCEQKK